MGFGLRYFDAGFAIFGILWFVMFALIMGVFIFTFVRGIKQWNKNNHSPRLTVPATVVAKRTNVSRHRRSSSDFHTISTTYFATFQFESGDRLELMMDGYAYGMLIEGDEGDLTFQGTRYLGFERR